MQWMSMASGATGAFCIYLVLKSLRINSKAVLNRWIALTGAGLALWNFGNGLALVALDMDSFMVLIRLSSSGYIVYQFAAIAALVTFSKLSGIQQKILLIIPGAVALLTMGQNWTGIWLIEGFSPSTFGNVFRMPADSPWVELHDWTALYNFLVGLGTLVHGWFREPSRRYRAITLKVIALSVLGNGGVLFTAGVAWLVWGYPDTSPLLAIIGVSMYLHLFHRYGHLAEDRPDLSDHLFQSLHGLVFFVNNSGVVIRASKKAADWLDHDPLGMPIALVLPQWPDLAAVWQSMMADLQARSGIRSTESDSPYKLSLLPQLNRYGEPEGVVVRLLPCQPGAVEELAERHALSPRECEVAVLAMEGLDTREIADELCISLSTVKNHLHALYSKTGTSSRSELVSLLLSHSTDE